MNHGKAKILKRKIYGESQLRDIFFWSLLAAPDVLVLNTVFQPVGMFEVIPSSLATCFDEIASTNGDDEYREWVAKILDSKRDVVEFVSRHRQGEGEGVVGEYSGFLKGSFNFSFRINFSDGQDVIIRFPKPGHTAFAEEKVANEVAVMEYLRQHTTIPIPRVHAWGLTKESPRQLGPFIIMDFVNGTLLSTILKQPNNEQDLILDPNIDSARLEKVYRQIAGYMLQLSQLHFSQIGAISKADESNKSNTWSVTARPLTYNMNELATVTSYPRDQFPLEPFQRTSDYLASTMKEHLTHLWTQRNLADSPQIARGRFIARQRLLQLIPKYCVDDTGPFIPYCDDLRPSNILVDPETLQITAVIDLEFTNSMPAQFTYDPPWWLLLSGPEAWLDAGRMDEFLHLFVPIMEQFLRILEQVEDERERGSRIMKQRLSAQMRDSWKTGRFWFDYAIRRSFDLDVVYWAALRLDDDGAQAEAGLVEDEMGDMKVFIETKMQQLNAYKEECAMKF